MNRARQSIDIVIVNYNSTAYLKACLNSMDAALGGLAANIFIEDNGSQDGVEQIEQSHPRVFLRRNGRNLGFSRAVNQALGRGSAPYVLLLNPDTTAQEGFLGTLLDYMERHPEVGVAGPRVLDPHGTVQASARSHPTPVTAFFGRGSLLSKCFPGNRFTRRNLLTSRCDGIHPMEVDWVSGACMLIRRAALEEVGLLDERFFMYWEDADLCLRMRRKGWKVAYVPQASIYHLVGGSSEQLLARSIFEFHKSSYILFDKYAPPSAWVVRPIVILGLALRMFAVFCAKEISLGRKEVKDILGRRPGMGSSC